MTETKRWGAMPEEWEFFLKLGLMEDLLPVVSNPHAKISPKSSMSHIGKTPSMYNGDGFVVGISNWTKKKTNAKEIELWMQEPDYGICIQTRNIRAFDIDIENSKQVSHIIAAIEEMLGMRLPMRFRTNSSKCLLAYRMAGRLGKRIIRTKHGMVECLADGQQFVAAGTHPSGERYLWDWDRTRKDRRSYA